VSTRADQRRWEIALVAAELFDRRGFHNTSMANIAEAVGVRKPTLYHYFPSKDDILFAIHDEFIELLIQRQERRLETAMPVGHLLREIMGDVLELMETHRGHVRVFIEHRRELSGEAYEAITRKREKYEDMIRAVFARGAAEGTLRPVDPGLATLALAGMCNWAYQWYQGDGRLATRDIAYIFWDYLYNGMAAQPRVAGAMSPGAMVGVDGDGPVE
jgi:TetR/AcrR family transcriptional regulator, cholesterol catabolism regulator